MKNLRWKEPVPYPGPDIWKRAVDDATTVIDSSHTPRGAFGHVLSRIEPVRGSPSPRTSRWPTTRWPAR